MKLMEFDRDGLSVEVSIDEEQTYTIYVIGQATREEVDAVIKDAEKYVSWHEEKENPHEGDRVICLMLDDQTTPSRIGVGKSG